MTRRSSLPVVCGALAACGSDEGPTAEFGIVVGTWRALSVDVINVADSAQRVDLIADYGMQLTLHVNGNGTYRAVVVFPGFLPDTVSGTWEIVSGRLILDGETFGSFSLDGGFVLSDAISGGSGGRPLNLTLKIPGYYNFGSGTVPVQLIYRFEKEG